MKLLLKSLIFVSVNISMVYGDWNATQHIVPQGAVVGAEVGRSIAISGSTVLIGAALQTVDAVENVGEVYVYDLNESNGLELTDTLQGLTAVEGDRFGVSIDISDNYAFIGATGDDEGGTNRGAVYIFEKNELNIWEQTDKLVYGHVDNGGFGGSVSIDGNYSVISGYKGPRIFLRNDEDTWVMVSWLGDVDLWSPHEVLIKGEQVFIGTKGSNSYEGAVYIYKRNMDDTFTEIQKLTAFDTAAGDVFGATIDVESNTMLIGASGDDPGGSVYVYNLETNGTWSYVEKIIPEDNNLYDGFGSSFSLSGNNAIIGAVGAADDGQFSPGAAYFYSQESNGTWTEGQKYLGATTGTQDSFGGSTAIDGNIALVGAPRESSLTGAAYLYENMIDPIVIDTTSDFTNNGSNDLLWHEASTGAVKIMEMNGMSPETNITVVDSSNLNLIPKGIGDFNADGKPDILVHNQNTGMARAWIMDGTTRVDGTALLDSSNTNLQIAGVADFDGDGDSDIAAFNTNSGTLRIWVMEGTVRVGNVLVLSGANLNLVPRGAGDMDNDGIPDLVLRNNNSGAVRVWTMNNDFTRKGNEYVTGSSNTYLELRGVVDIDGDGNADILNYNTNTGKLRSWLMDGSMGILENAEVTQDTDLDWSVRN